MASFSSRGPRLVTLVLLGGAQEEETGETCKSLSNFLPHKAANPNHGDLPASLRAMLLYCGSLGKIQWWGQKCIIVLTNSWQQSFSGQLVNSIALTSCLWVKMVSALGPLPLGCVHCWRSGFPVSNVEAAHLQPQQQWSCEAGEDVTVRHSYQPIPELHGCKSGFPHHYWCPWGVLNPTHSCSRPQTVAYSPAISLESTIMGLLLLN